MKGRPVTEAILLGARLIAARGMSVLTLIVAAWLVNIESFAEFGVYQTLATLAFIALFLRYDAAIVAARSEAEAGEVLRLCAGIGGLLWLVFTSAAIVAGLTGVMRMELALLLPLSILARGLMGLFHALTTREGKFKDLGRAPLVHALVQPTVLILLVLSPVEDALCFALADVAGHASNAAFLVWRRRKHLRTFGHDWTKETLIRTAQRWKNLPSYSLPSSFLSLAFATSPLLIMPMVASAAFAGHVALAYRLFDVPTQIIMAASTPIFLNRLRPCDTRANPIFGRSVMIGLVLALVLAYAAMAGLLVLAKPLLGGTSLANLAGVVPYVALFQVFVALAAPINESCGLYPGQKHLPLIQGIAVLGALLVAGMAAYAGYYPKGVLLVLAGLSFLRAVALGELLRKLSSLSHAAFVTAPSGAKVPAHERVKVEGH